VAYTDDKKRARLNIITHLLSQIPYEPLDRKDVELPKRGKKKSDDDLPPPPTRDIPTPYG
jgi:hypothetical protein